jgi:hypothetical protein
MDKIRRKKWRKSALLRGGMVCSSRRRARGDFFQSLRQISKFAGITAPPVSWRPWRTPQPVDGLPSIWTTPQPKSRSGVPNLYGGTKIRISGWSHGLLDTSVSLYVPLSKEAQHRESQRYCRITSWMKSFRLGRVALTRSCLVAWNIRQNYIPGGFPLELRRSYTSPSKC